MPFKKKEPEPKAEPKPEAPKGKPPRADGLPRNWIPPEIARDGR